MYTCKNQTNLSCEGKSLKRDFLYEREDFFFTTYKNVTNACIHSGMKL